MLVKTEAIVLHSFKYGERRIIVDMFTREHGRLSFIVPLPSSAKGRMKKQYFQPLTLLSIECDVRQQAQLQKLHEAALLAPLPSLLTEPGKLAIGLFVAEFLYHALKGEQQNMLLFDYVRGSIEWLDGCTGSYANFHLVFLMRLSRFLGFYPNLEDEERFLKNKVWGAKKISCEAACPPQRNGERGAHDKPHEAVSPPHPFFDLRAASFCPSAPTHTDFLMPQEASHISVLMRMDYPTMHVFRLSRADRNRILEILLRYYRLHLPAFPEMRSLAVLHELFG